MTGSVRPVPSFDPGEDTDRIRQTLQTDGVVLLSGAFDRTWLDVIETGIADALGGSSADVDVVKRDGDAGAFSFSSGAWRSVEPFRRFIFDSPLADLVWPLLHSSSLTLFYDFLLIKEPLSGGASTPWHQDHSYYPLDGTEVVNSWVALDHIPLETSLRFLSGSHRDQTLYRAVNFENPDSEYRHARPELPETPQAVGDAPILSSPLQPGDTLVWWSYTLHSAPGNHLDRRRAAFSVNWVGDDVVYNGAAALDTYLDDSLVVDQPIISESFPLVRSTSAADPRIGQAFSGHE